MIMPNSDRLNCLKWRRTRCAQKILTHMKIRQ